MGIKVEKSGSLKIGEESYNDVLCIRLITWRRTSEYHRSSSVFILDMSIRIRSS